MSGGHFDYFYGKLLNFVDEISWCGEGEIPRDLLPEEKELKKLCKDLADVLHDYEWWRSGDYGKEDFLKAYAKFKKKLKCNI